MTSHGTVVPSSLALECCMCGDYGLPYELFRCKACPSRFQHRYCSNLYPKAESYQVCNWCLKKKGGKIEGTYNSSLSSVNNVHSNEEVNKDNKNKSISDKHVHLKVQRSSLQFHLHNPIKKPRSPSSSARKKVISSSCMEETLTRTKSKEISNPGITKQVFRGKVRKYKLLDEVSS